MAPELIAELGSPFDQLWPLLASRYGELGAARVVSRLLGAIVDHGQAAVARALEAALALGDVESLRESLASSPPRVSVPEALAGYQVESACAADYAGFLSPEVWS